MYFLQKTKQIVSSF